jgi:hypothetical protein
VLLFLSDAAIDSKWVRREAKFADAIAKPLIMVNLGVSRPPHGMALLMKSHGPSPKGCKASHVPWSAARFRVLDATFRYVAATPRFIHPSDFCF